MSRHHAIEPLCDVLAIALLLFALHQGLAAGLIQAKAWFAPVLIERAWQQGLAAGGESVKPWPWADTWPVAKLRVPSRGLELLVLHGDSGNALAFGPGHTLASAPLGSEGLAVVGGHRDTHFAFLRDIAPGARMELQLPSGEWRHYRVESARVVDADRETLTPIADAETLMLVTCYPFDALDAGGPLRYAVRAQPVFRNLALL